MEDGGGRMKKEPDMNKLDADDPRFTAKALNETLADSENAEIEASSQEEFEELQEFAGLLEKELKADKGDAMLEGERLEAIKSASSPKRKYTILQFPVWASTLAATVAVGFVTLVSIRTWQEGDSIAEQEMRNLSDDVMRGAATADGDAALLTVQEERDTDLPTEEAFVVTPASNESASSLYGEAKVGTAQDRLSELRSQAGKPATSMETQHPQAATVLNEPSQQAPVPLDTFQSTDPNVILRNRSRGAIQSQPNSIAAETESDMGFADEKEEVILLSPFQVAAGEFQRQEAKKGDFLVSNESGFAESSQGSRRTREQQAQPVLSLNRLSLALPPSPAPDYRIQREDSNREGYARIVENEFKNPLDHPLSTFSIDVDTASYANVRRFLNQGVLPPTDAVRIEEMVNYFAYAYEEPKDDHPFATLIEAASAPWKPEHRLVRIGLKGKEIEKADRPNANLVFLVDVSGSMSNPNKLPWVKESLKMLTEQMGTNDRVAIVVYAGASGLALPSTTANNKETILHALDRMRSGGSTNGGAGINLAYKVASDHFIEDGINRVILCTDGDFNVGTTDQGSLTRLIEEKAKTGIFFSAIGYGMGNYQDSMMEELSNRGNGNYAYIDSLQEANKVFVEDLLGTLMTIAKDVKIQVEFNPTQVNAYRLIGYENRKLAKEDFNDDTKDAGEIGAGHTVTALYEIVPVGIELETPSVDPLRYQTSDDRSRRNAVSDELLTVKLRYKEPDADTSQLLEFPFAQAPQAIEQASTDLRFAASVAGLGMLLRDSQHKGDITFSDVINLAESAKGSDTNGRRSEFVGLVRKARDLSMQNGANGRPNPVPSPEF